MLQWTESSFACKILLPKMHSLGPIRVYSRQTQTKEHYKIIACFKNDKKFLIDCFRSKKTKEPWQLHVIYDLGLGLGSEKVNAT